MFAEYGFHNCGLYFWTRGPLITILVTLLSKFVPRINYLRSSSLCDYRRYHLHSQPSFSLLFSSVDPAFRIEM